MLGGNFAVLGLMVTWLTPLWLLSVGAAIFGVAVGVIYGLLKLAAPRAARVMEDGIREGILLPVLFLVCLLSALSVVGLTVVNFKPLVAAVLRIPATGPYDVDVQIPALTHDYSIPIEKLNFRPVELQSFELESDQPLAIYTWVSKGAGNEGLVKLSPNHPASWNRTPGGEKTYSREFVDWKVDNLTDAPANLHIHTLTDIDHPQVRLIPKVALGLAALFAVYFLLRQLAPKVSAIAVVTAREVMAQPLYYIVLALGCSALFAFIIIPYYTFGEDVKMLKDSGLTLIMVLSILVAVWSASVSISEEIEGRTALTLLSKPIRRQQFILGKFLGILAPTVLMFILLGFVFLVTISIKVVYDAREMAMQEPTWQACYGEMVKIFPGLVLAFLETMVLSAISVALSTRLPMVANLVVCATIYVLGHLVPLLVASSVDKFAIVHFIGMFLATILPVLDHFNIQAAVAAGADVPLAYLGLTLLYGVLYSAIALLAALALFEDRDLA